MLPSGLNYFHNKPKILFAKTIAEEWIGQNLYKC